MAQSSYRRSRMIMGIRGDLAALALLAQLVTLSTGNVTIEDDGPVDSLRSRNITSLPNGYDDSTNRYSNTTDVIDENELVVELEEALIGAASSGRVILIEPSANAANSTAMLQGPVIVIETPANMSGSLSDDFSGWENDERGATSSISDQEIAQSQIRRKTTSHDYNDSEENLENYEDLLAITEYEPQRIDAKSVDEEISRVTDDEFNSTPQSTSVPRAEDTYYEVPKRTEPDESLNEASTEKREIISNSRQTELNPKAASTYLTERKLPTIISAAPSNVDGKPVYEEISRGTRNSDTIVPLTRNSSAPTKLTINEVATKNPLPGVRSSYNPTSTFVPSSSARSDPHPKNIFPANARTSNRPHQRPSSVPLASKRNDDYTNDDDIESNNDKLPSSYNHRNGYSNRYDEPTLVTKKVRKARLYPVVTDYEQPEASEELAEEEQSDEEGDYEENSETSSRAAIPVNNLYPIIEKTTSNLGTPGKPGFVDYQRADQDLNQRHQPGVGHPNSRPNSNARTNHPNESYHRNGEGSPANRSYEKDRSFNADNLRTRNGLHPRKMSYANFPLATTPIPAQASYEQNVDESPATQSHEKIRVSNGDNSRTGDGIYPRKLFNGNALAATTTIPARESYAQNNDGYHANRKPESVRNFEAGNRQARNEINPTDFPREKFPVTATTILPRGSYEDERSPDLVNQRHRLAPIKNPQQWTPRNTYVVPGTQVYQPYDYLGRSEHLFIPSSSLVNNPTHQLHGTNTNPGFVAANVINDTPTNYYHTKSPAATAPPQGQSTPTVLRGTRVHHEIYPTTPAPDSPEHSDDPENPTLTSRVPNNPDHARHREQRPYHNLYAKNPNEAKFPVSVPTRNTNSKYPSGEPIDHRYPVHRTTDESLPTPKVGHFVAEPSTPGYVVNVHDDDKNFNGNPSYVTAATKLQPPNRSRNLKRNNRKYESHRNGDDEDTIVASDSGKSVEFDGPDYVGRVRPRVVPEHAKNVVAHYPGAALTAPGRSEDVRRVHEGRRRVSVGVEQEPVESVHRADVDEAAHEDAVPVDSGQAEYQATRRHHTHAEAVKPGGGGGAGGEHKHEEGGGAKHEEDHHEAHGEKGDKGYEDYHGYDKGKKGHHDKESHDKEYDEKKGNEKKHEDESGYHKEHHHGEKGEKEAEFAEKGEHQKGHSTKGQHVVHKKDEYEKKTEFYDESHEEEGDEKEGAYHHEHENKKGGHHKKGHHNSGHHEDKYGEKGEHEKGHHYHEKKGHDGKDGEDKHHQHHEKYGKKGGHEDGFKWSHEKPDDGHGGGQKAS